MQSKHKYIRKGDILKAQISGKDYIFINMGCSHCGWEPTKLVNSKWHCLTQCFLLFLFRREVYAVMQEK